jgi:predicted acylesterase/phospholipase RssA
MPETFEIGVVMAGAISAGAYTAGVIDFLFEALDDYYAERQAAGWDGPRHDVRIPIMAGASAGGMTAAIAGLHAFRNMEHVWGPPPPAARNRLYSSWVSDISIERLLELTDLGNHAALQSALCCDVLDEIVRDAFSIDGEPRSRDWIGRPGDPTLRLRLTLTNTRGVPYSFKLFGQDTSERFGMLNHADFQEFVVGQGKALDAAATAGAISLDAEDFKAPAWAALRQAALATGAFPIGLRPRLIHRDDTSAYFQPSFSHFHPDNSFAGVTPYDFVAVDGGTIDNEPLELARRYLEGDVANDHSGAGASKAVVLIAPFPSRVVAPKAMTDTSFVQVIGALLTSMKQQARFKPEELAKAADEENFSRYMIAPTRAGNHSEAAEKYPIACGVMGGFGGFLHESFRRHDYLLGRRNAQAFLRWNFALPKGNPLFGGAEFPARWVVKNPGARIETLAPEADSGLPAKPFAPGTGDAASQIGYPIIPLTDRMLAPIEIGAGDLPLPQEVSVDDLKHRISQRARSAVGALVDDDLPRLFPALTGLIEAGLKIGAVQFGAHLATEWGVKQIEQALADVAAAFEP